MRSPVPGVLVVVAGLLGAEMTQVASVYDGRTFLTADSQVVRMLGINTPEIYQPGGDICRDVLEKHVLGRIVRLEAGKTDADDDGQLLRYVYVGDTLVNGSMLRKGFASLLPELDDAKLRDSLRQLELTAARIGKGLWPFDVFPPPSLKLPSGDISKYLVEPDTGGLPGLDVVSWAETDECYGRLVKVVGIVVATYRSEKVFIMNFHQDYRRHFKAVVFAGDLGKFPACPEDYYKKRLVRLTGTIKEYQNAPEMIINDPGQIEILE